MNDTVPFDMPEVPTFEPLDTSPGNSSDVDRLGEAIAKGAAIGFGAVIGAQADKITSYASSSTMSTNATNLWGLA